MSRSELRGYTDGYSKFETHVKTADKSGQSWCVHTTIWACGVRDIISEVRMLPVFMQLWHGGAL